MAEVIQTKIMMGFATILTAKTEEDGFWIRMAMGFAIIVREILETVLVITANDVVGLAVAKDMVSIRGKNSNSFKRAFC